MSAPRQVLEGSTSLLTRRCSQRQFLIKPSPFVAQVMSYCLAGAAQKFGILIHDVVVMANHYHIVATDPHGRIPDFMRELNRNTAKCLNTHYQRQENFWSSSHYGKTDLQTADDIVDKIVYTLANPVAAGLVECASQWPGFTTQRMAYGETLVVRRPEGYFRDDGTMPAEVTFKRVRPPGFDHLSDSELTSLVAKRVEDKELELRAEMTRQGRSFMGVAKCLDVSPYDYPTAIEPRQTLIPKIAARNPEVRVAAIARLKTFLSEYRDAYQRWREGIRDVVFPAGTYALRHYGGVRIRAPAV